MVTPPRNRTIAIAAGVAALALAAAGCGGGAKTPSVASLGTTSTSSSGAASGKATGGAGGSSSQTSSGAGNGNSAHMAMVGGSIQQLSRFAACMRKNGEPSFPDPNAQGQISANVDPSSAQFQRAQQACQKLMPNGGTPSPAQEEQARSHALAFSACMRSHGEPNFPDPQFGSGGRVSIKIGRGAGIDPSSPQFQAAQTACQKDISGKKLGAPPSGAVGPKGAIGG